MKQYTFPEIYPVTCHTDHVGLGSVFVAIQGTKEDGLAYVIKALQKGAKTIVVQENTLVSSDIAQAVKSSNAELIYVENSRKALAELSAKALGYPANKLKIIGITGTKGKSTTTFLVEHLLRTAGYKTALLSTVKNRILDADFPTQLTTQQPDYLHLFFHECATMGVEYVVMEVAAQALSLYRVHGITFDAGLFTNFSLEHSEFYATQEDYFAAKTQLFNQLKSGGLVVLNADDENVASLADVLCALPPGSAGHSRVNAPTAHPERSAHREVLTFGLNNQAAIRARVGQSNLDGICMTIFDGTKALEIQIPALVGTFNVYNILGAYSLVHKLIDSETIKAALRTFAGVPGRLQKILLPNNARAFIDYAHNPSSFEAVLGTLRALSNHLIVIFGAGGDRDASKRPLMGSIAATIADKVIITSDNPRSEDPQSIADQIIAGIDRERLSKVAIELDRARAIQLAYRLSKQESMIVLLGKGPDEYQIIKGVKTPFSEAAILRSL